MDALIGFWSYALAAVAFAALLLLGVLSQSRQPRQRALLAAFAVTASWAWLTAIQPLSNLALYAETARNLVWIGALYTFSAAGDERQRGVQLVYGATAAVLGMQLLVTGLVTPGASSSVTETSDVLRLIAAAGALVLVHNFYGQAAPATRSHIRFAMIGLVVMWLYDLNFYTLRYFEAAGTGAIENWRGVAVALTAPLFALGSREDRAWKFKLSRSAGFQSLSLIAICAYFLLMAVITTALRGASVSWSSTMSVVLLSVMTVAAIAFAVSARSRGWIKVNIAKHMFEHRYDYRLEWLRFTDTLGGAGALDAPLSERIVKAFADLVDAPGGLLLAGGTGGIRLAATWNWDGDPPGSLQLDEHSTFWREVESSGRIIEFEGTRHGWASPRDQALKIPQWLSGDTAYWVGIPLIHDKHLSGFVILAAPEYSRPLDWEDFDLLRAAGRQAASSLAEALGQEALANAQRFEEFNRRFAFILHDIKNLVSQLSLLARNAERHADNPEFREDMVATLRSSVSKMNDLLARLSPKSQGRVQKVERQPLGPILTDTIAARCGGRDVELRGEASFWVEVDAPALEQALGHLLQNAIEASPVIEPIVVKVTGAGDHVAIAVIDKGCGMDSEFIRNRLFQPFASSKPTGFGVGAHEARSIICAMGGHLAVDSQPGKGTTFTILLRAADAAPLSERKRA